MEMHTASSLWATHGLVVQPTPRRWLPWIRSLAAVWSSLHLAVVRELEIRRAIETLESMDDHMLTDIGIDRSQIQGAVRPKAPHLPLGLTR